MPDLPRLIAFDADDLTVIAANLQDALVRVGDMAFLPNRNNSRWSRRGSIGCGPPRKKADALAVSAPGRACISGVFSRSRAWAFIVETRRLFSISWISALRKPSRPRGLWSLSSPPAGRCGSRSNASKPKSAILGFAGKQGRRHIIPLTAARTKPDRLTVAVGLRANEPCVKPGYAEWGTCACSLAATHATIKTSLLSIIMDTQNDPPEVWRGRVCAWACWCCRFPRRRGRWGPSMECPFLVSPIPLDMSIIGQE